MGGYVDRDNTIVKSSDQGRIQGGGGAAPPPPHSESLGIDFYTGFRKKSRYTLYSGVREEKDKGGGVQFEILKIPGIDYFYSGFRKTSQGGGGANLIPKKMGPP